MKYVIHRISLDVGDDSDSKIVISAKKGDNAKKLIVTLLEDKHHYRISKDCYAFLVAKRPNDQIPLTESCVIDLANNKVEYTFSADIVKIEGKVECEIFVNNEKGEVLTTARFLIRVFQTVMSSAESDNASEIRTLTDLITETAVVAQEAKTATQNAETATQNANDLVTEIERKIENGELNGVFNLMDGEGIDSLVQRSSGGVDETNSNTGDGSAVFGRGNNNSVKDALIAGKYNNKDSEALFQVGNGESDDARSNAFEVYEDGRAKVYGTPMDEEDVVRKVDLDNAVSLLLDDKGLTATLDSFKELQGLLGVDETGATGTGLIQRIENVEASILITDEQLDAIFA